MAELEAAKRGSLFDRAPVFSPSACLVRRHKDLSCDACVAGCPEEALTGDGVPSFSPERCSNCGLCYLLCPAEAFQPLAHELNGLLANLERAVNRAGEVGLACSKVLEERGWSYPAVVEVECLARFDLSLIAAAAARGARSIWLDASGCDGCKNEVLSAVADNVSAASNLIQMFPPELEMKLVAALPASVLRRKVGYGRLGTGEAVSRRDFLSNLRRVSVVDPERSSVAAREEARLGELVRRPSPASRRELLLQSLAALGEPRPVSQLVTNLPFGTVFVGDGCNFCGICVLTCPGKALNLSGNGQAESPFWLEFEAATCTACKVCEVACPRSALVVSKPEDISCVLSPRTERVKGPGYRGTHLFEPSSDAEGGLEISLPGGAPGSDLLSELGEPVRE